MCELQLGFGERDFLCRSLCSFLVLCGLLDASAVVDYGLLSSTVCINIAISLRDAIQKKTVYFMTLCKKVGTLGLRNVVADKNLCDAATF